jgi:hypothetical protein
MLRVVLVNVLLLALGLVGVELAFGGWLSDEGFGAVNLPRSVRLVADVGDLYAGGGQAVYTRDAYGLRGDYGTPADIDILSVGGSTTNELHVDDCCTWTAMLAKRFAAAGRPLTVANAGVDGQSTVGHIWNFDHWFARIPGLKPRYVLAFIGINEHHITLDGRGEDLPEYDDLGRRLRQAWRNNSVLYGLYRTAVGVVRARRAELTHARLDFAQEDWETLPRAAFAAFACPAERVAAFRARLAVLAEKIAQLGATPVFVTQQRGDVRFTGDTVAGVVRTRGLRRQQFVSCYNRGLMGYCEAEGLLCVDLASGIRFTDGDHYDSIHTTPQGSAKIADFLFDALKDRIE